jgi:hypothetical protein
MKFRLTLLPVLLTVFFIFPSDAFACACCSENGFYSIWTGKPDGYYLETLEKIKFAADAELYVDAAGFEQIKGLEAMTKNSEETDLWQFGLTDSFLAKTWKLNFKAKNGKTGTLVLPLPTQMVAFKADIHDGKTSGGGGPLLYKEWRFKGNVQSGNGFFASGIAKPTTYFLVLQGRGNGCDNAEDYTHWRLEINGKKADYKFIGKLASGVKSMSEEN